MRLGRARLRSFLLARVFLLRRRLREKLRGRRVARCRRPEGLLEARRASAPGLDMGRIRLGLPRPLWGRTPCAIWTCFLLIDSLVVLTAKRRLLGRCCALDVSFRPGRTREGNTNNRFLKTSANYAVRNDNVKLSVGANQGPGLASHWYKTQTTGAARIRLSTRSRTPPWPGSSLPESFTAAARL